MTGPQHHRPPLLDLEHSHRNDRRHAPVTFHDGPSLQRLLERRGAERRSRERRGIAASPTPNELGARELCHDLRQPLAAAAVLAHVLDDEPGLSEVGRARLQQLQHELARLGGMLTGHLESERTELVDLAELVRDICAGAAHMGRAVVEVLDDPAPLITAQRVLLSRMLRNLVTNAQDAAGAAGVVRALVEPSPLGAVVHVEDSGAAAGQPHPSGYGLGLMIAQSVARRHGGTLSCTPSRLGGLRITVALPAALPAQRTGGAP